AYDYESILLIDTEGNLLLGKGNHLDVSPVVQTLLSQSIAGKQIMHTDLYREENGHIHLDWVVPIIARQDSGEHVIAAIVLRVDPHRFLYSIIQSWPTRSDSAETLLVRKEDNAVLYLNELRHLKDTALVLKKSLSTPALPAAAAVQTDQPGMMRGRDYRGIEVLAAYRPIPGTDWHIVAKINRAEVLTPIWQTLKWIVAIALVAALSIFLAFWMLLRKQRQLQKLEVEAEKTKVNQQIQALGDNLPNGFIYQYERMSNGQKRFSYISAGVERTIGLKPSQVMADANLLFAQVAPEHLPAYLKAEAHSLRELNVYSGELLLNLPNRQQRWLQVQSQPHRQLDGGIVWDGIAIDITEQHLAAQKIKESEERFHKLFEDSSQPLMLLEDGHFIDANRATLMMLGFDTLDELINKSPDKISPEYQPDGQLSTVKAAENIRTAFEKGPHRLEWEHIKKDGQHFFVELVVTPIFFGSRAVLHVEWTDITQRKLAERRSALHKRLYVTVADINEKILHATDKQQLLDLICRIPIETGLMGMAWIGVEDAHSQRLVPLMKYGQGLDTLEQIVISTRADRPEGRGVTGTTWREQKPCINNNTLSNAAMAPWRSHALKYGWNSSASLPIFRHGDIYAVLTVFSAEVNFFDDEVMALLNSLVSDVSYALDGLDARQALLASEEHCRLILESANSGIYGLDNQGNTTFVNSVAAMMLGYSPEELAGTPMHATVHHSHADGSPYRQEDCPMYATLRDGQPRDICEEVLWRKDGSCFPVQYTTHPIYREGLLTGAVVVFQDISERLKTQEQLKRREEIFRSIVSQASDAICLIDADTLDFVEFNDAACESLGFSREEFAKLRLPDIQGEFDPDAVFRMMREYVQAGSKSFDTLRRRKDGTLRHVNVRLKALVLKGHNYLSLIWTDITDRVQMQQQLNRERQHLQNIIDGTHAGTWEWNLKTGEALFNERWAEIFGYQLSEL
ncbi:MAG: PAS domain S-box protein, partial [Methylococcaceae bacterium]